MDDCLEKEKAERERGDDCSSGKMGTTVDGEQNIDGADGGDCKKISDESKNEGLYHRCVMKEGRILPEGDKEVAHNISPFIQAEVEASQNAVSQQAYVMK